jgi:hypothetical protein
MRILEEFGTVDFDPAYDYKAERRESVWVDTPLWYQALRRRIVDLSPSERRLTQTLYQLIPPHRVS